ncbi:hypothetical protein GCM10011414_14560 [Croceivirga lutea]|uniref:hypothetical protein n=1 Tax=Croceivirga lutea TaxID=1775167 RepID=UPI00163A3725|nr:hypothetical protein [Croceivirga lutea]GGG46045.1 hypothetical protein GCM10011414_14560 [Croceivirga lutea]
MIIYGTRSTHLDSKPLPTAVCPHCTTKGQLTASVFSRHVHVFWIPLFPAGRTGVFECQHCHKGFKKKELGEDGKREYKNFNGNVRTPIWKYSGLAIIALLIAFGIYSSSQNNAKVAEMVTKPAMYDIYTFKTATNYYSTFKVANVFKDSMYVNYNDYEVERQSGIYKIDKKENYSDLIYVLTTAEIADMYKNGRIKNIKR